MAVEQMEMREVYINTLIELARTNKNIVLLDADLMKASKGIPFRETYPGRTVDVGVAEANMIGVAAGLAASGKIPFTHTFTPFATRRCFDQVTISVAYAGLNVKMVGSDPGVSAELNGGTHMSFEDIGLMRTLPGIIIFEPVDSVQLRQALPFIVEYDGPVYIRMFRKQAESIFGSDYTFDWAKGELLADGTDVTIIASGIMVKEALTAKELLAEEGLSVRVINIHTIKPIDQKIVLKAASETGAVVTAENHNIINGLGSAVAEVLIENNPVPMKRIGIRDHFGEVGKMAFLMEKYHLLSTDLVRACKEVIAKK